MFDEAISLLSIWASMNSWLTPTFLFLFLNLMIGTIFITSGFNSSKPHHQHHQQPPQQPPSHITRAPSVIQRLKSINFYSYSSPSSDPFHEPAPGLELEKVPARVLTHVQAQTQTQNQVQTQTWAPVIEEDITDDEGPTLDEIYSRIKGISSHHHTRQNSDTIPTGGEIPVKLLAKMKKSASHKSAFNHFQAVNTDENVTAAAVEEMEKISAAVTTTSDGGGTEVDAMADDFINRFKKELQLQRIESIVRYKDMITRGSEK